MDYEDFLVEIYTPLNAIINLSNIIYTKSNEDWNFCGVNSSRKNFEELLSLNFAIKLCAKYLLNKRKYEIDKMG